MVSRLAGSSADACTLPGSGVQRASAGSVGAANSAAIVTAAAAATIFISQTRRLIDIAGAHLSRTHAVARRYQPLAFHLLDHTRSSIVSDSQTALDHRDRGLVGLEHDSHRLVVKLVVLAPASVES